MSQDVHCSLSRMRTLPSPPTSPLAGFSRAAHWWHMCGSQNIATGSEGRTIPTPLQICGCCFLLATGQLLPGHTTQACCKTGLQLLRAGPGAPFIVARRFGDPSTLQPLT